MSSSPHAVRIPAALLALSLAGCTPVGNAPVPAAVVPAVSAPAPVPAAPAIPAAPVAAPIAVPVAVPAPVRQMLIDVVVPAGAFAKLRSSLRTQGGPVAATELTAADLGKLAVTVNGKAPAADQVRYDGLVWDDLGQLRFRLALDGVQALPGTDVRLQNAVGTFLLALHVDGRFTTWAGESGPLTLDVRSTAKALLVEALASAGKPDLAIPSEAVDLVAARVFARLTASDSINLLTDSGITTAVAGIATALVGGTPADQLSQLPALHPRPTSGGGGGGAGTGGGGGGGGGGALTVPAAIAQTWTDTGLSTGSFTLSPSNSSLLFRENTGSKSVTYFRSTDGAASWSTAPSITNSVLAFHPTVATKLYLADTNGIAISTDSGATNTAVGLAGSFARSVAFHPTNAQTMYASLQLGMAKSTDGGASWSALAGGLPGGTSWQVMVDPQTPTTVYSRYGNDLYKSTDAGATWASIKTVSSLAFTVSASTPSKLFLGDSNGNGNVFTSTDGGGTWSTVAVGTLTGVRALAADPNNAAVIYAGGSTAGGGAIYQSTDSGATWTLWSAAVGVVTQIVVDKANSKHLFMAANNTLWTTQ